MADTQVSTTVVDLTIVPLCIEIEPFRCPDFHKPASKEQPTLLALQEYDVQDEGDWVLCTDCAGTLKIHECKPSQSVVSSPVFNKRFDFRGSFRFGLTRGESKGQIFARLYFLIIHCVVRLMGMNFLSPS